ncbi:MAG: maltokinase N-terminal cap-like domain-containing protein [Candidatus Dormibacteria bacterium]
MTEAPALLGLPGIEDALQGVLPQERWFADKHRQLQSLRIAQVYWLRRELPALAVALVDLTFSEGVPATYQLVLGLRPWNRHLSSNLRSVAHRVGSGDGGSDSEAQESWAIYDAFADPILAAAFIAALAESRSIGGQPRGQLRFRLLHPPLPPLPTLQPNQGPPKDQSQSSMVYGDDILVKVLRRVWPGINPEVEILEALDVAGFVGIPRPVGVVEAESQGETISLAVAQNYLRNGSDGFTLALTSLRDLYGDRLLDADGAVPLPENSAQAVQGQGASFAGAAAQIGDLTAEMHLALARLPEGPLGARPLSQDDLQAIADDLDAYSHRLLGLDDVRLEPLAVHAGALEDLARKVVRLAPQGRAIRIHGDYHLGQLLRTDAGWHALDFEGRPAVPISVRRRKATPLQDVAGMLRSFDYAASVALRQQVDAADVGAASLAPLGRAWSAAARQAFMDRYLERVSAYALLPDDPEGLQLLLTCLQASQALYEVDYELHSRPDWVSIPLEGLARLLSTPELTPEAATDSS